MGISTRDLRFIIQGLTLNGERSVRLQVLYQAAGAESSQAKRQIRNIIRKMKGRQELILNGVEGVYAFNPQALLHTGDSYVRIWKAVRSSRPGWSISEISQVANVARSQVSRFLRFLEREGFIARHGRSGNTLLYRATGLARETRRTPFPAKEPVDGYARERGAACQLVRLMMEYEPWNVAGKIVKECRVLLARFGNEEGGGDE